MKLDNRPYQVESNTRPIETLSFSCSFSKEAMAHAFEMQTLKFYAEPVYAAIRETVTNMLDSMTRAGKQDVPIKITLPTEEDSTLTFEDEGIGMDLQDLQRCFMEFGSSDKRDTNEEFGAFGWGSKSINCLSDTASIDSVKDGIRYECIWYIGQDRLPKLDLINRVETTACNGTKIQLAIPKKDIELVHCCVKRVSFFIEPEIVINNDYAIPARNLANSRTGNFWTNYCQPSEWVEVPEISAKVHKYLFNPLYLTYAITINGLLYGVSAELPQNFVHKVNIKIDEKHSNYRITLEPTNYSKAQVIIQFEIGDLEFTTSRDAIKDTVENKQKVFDKLQQFVDEWYRYNKYVYDNAKTLPEFYNLSPWNVNIFYVDYCYYPKLPLIPDGNPLNGVHSSLIKPRYTRTSKLLNGLVSIARVSNGEITNLSELSLRDSMTIPVYIVVEKYKDRTVIPEGLSDYILLTFRSLNSFFSVPHDLAKDLWHYPDKVINRITPKEPSAVTKSAPIPCFDKLVPKGLLKCAELRKDKNYHYNYPYEYAKAITELPDQSIFVYIDSKDNTSLSEAKKNVLLLHNINYIYVTTPKIERVLPATFIPLNRFIDDRVKELEQDYGVFIEPLKGYLYNVKESDFILATLLNKKLRLNSNLKILERMKNDTRLPVLGCVVYNPDNILNKIYADCNSSSLYYNNVSNRLSNAQTIAMISIVAKLEQADKAKLKSLFYYLSQTKDLVDSMFIENTCELIIKSL